MFKPFLYKAPCHVKTLLVFADASNNTAYFKKECENMVYIYICM